MAPKAASEPVGCLHAPAERPTPNYMHLCTIATSVCNGCQSSTARAKPPAHFFWPIQPSNMLDTTTLLLCTNRSPRVRLKSSSIKRSGSTQIHAERHRLHFGPCTDYAYFVFETWGHRSVAKIQPITHVWYLDLPATITSPRFHR